MPRREDGLLRGRRSLFLEFPGAAAGPHKPLIAPGMACRASVLPSASVLWHLAAAALAAALGAAALPDSCRSPRGPQLLPPVLQELGPSGSCSPLCRGQAAGPHAPVHGLERFFAARGCNALVHLWPTKAQSELSWRDLPQEQVLPTVPPPGPQ